MSKKIYQKSQILGSSKLDILQYLTLICFIITTGINYLLLCPGIFLVLGDQSIWTKPRHRGLGEECTKFFRKDARSNPAANSSNLLERTTWKRKHGAPVNDHRRASALEQTRSQARKVWRRDSIRRMWIEERERKNERNENVREDVIDMKHSKHELQQETRPVEACFIECYPSSCS